MNTVQTRRAKWGETALIRSFVVFVFSAALAQMPASAAGAAKADSLLAIDQHRSAVIDRVVRAWSVELAVDQQELLRTKLSKLRADQLLAASLSGSLEAVLDVMISAEQTTGKAPAREYTKALGEVDRDVVYTPLSTCRLVETRTVYPNFGIPYYGAGQFSAGEIRSYSLTATCGLPPGVTALQAQVQGQATAGFGANVEATRAGGPFGGGLTLIAANSPLFTVVSSPIPVNLSNNSIGVQVTVATAHLVIDVVGYFMPANRNGDGLRVFGAGTGTPSVVNGDDSNTVGSATAATISGGTGNTATGNNSTVAGGVLNQALGQYSSISGGQSNKTAADQGAIGGGLVNDIAVGAFQSTIAGGYNNKITAFYAAIGGGANNTASGNASVVAGGNSNTASGSSSVIAGGNGNKVLGYNSVVSGGGAGINSNCYNHASDVNPNPSDQPCWNETGGNNGIIGGGYNNRIAAPADTSAVVGGSMNRVNSSGSFIGGGVANTTSGNLSTIVGGRRHVASGSSAFVGGGDTNTASAGSAVVTGGNTNIASGGSSFVGGGSLNTVSGFNSAIVGGAGGKLAGNAGFVGSGGSGTGSTCYDHVLGTNTASCWNEITAGGNSVIVGGQDNASSNAWTFIGGGAGNRVLQNDSAIVGGWSNTISGANAFAAFIGGGARNSVAANSGTIVGGYLNSITSTGGNAAFIGAGRGNVVSGDRSVVVGGGSESSACWNRATGLFDQPCANVAAGRRNFVGAGVSNKSSGNESVIAGGSSNEATGSSATVGGGFGNLASGSASVIAGGGSSSINTCFNRATGLSDGPCQNVASGDFSTISGGIGNIASGRQSTISGGSTNLATAERATVGGGVVNTSSGLGATVPGGRANWASGAWSLAAGRGATTNDGATTPTHHFGTFVWSDTPDDGSSATPAATQLFYSSASNQFAVRARGGVVFKVDNVTVPANAGDATAGCSLPAGGSASWSCSSDRNLKEAIRAISPKQILAKVAAMPLSTWQFKGTERRHLSPMAQDFWAAFGFGEDNRHITASDVGGVALAAVQGLNLKLDAERADNRKKASEIALLKAELAKIKRKLGM